MQRKSDHLEASYSPLFYLDTLRISGIEVFFM